MQFVLHLNFIVLFLNFANGVVLKTFMTHKYPQVAVLGCDSRKANLYYDMENQVWVEHLTSPCVNSEESILEFCQQTYPSLQIGNIVRSDTVLRFENWCELTSPINKNVDNIHRCKQTTNSEEAVQPFRCLYMNTERENILLPTTDCSIHSIIGTGECLRAEKWQQLASIECANKSMSLNSSTMTNDWCGLSEFRGIEFVCCQIKKSNDNDYETIVDEQQDDNNSNEDDPIQESTSQRIISMTLAIREPTWMEDYRRWSTDPAYFADDEDTNDYQPLSVPKSGEYARFANEKENFKQKYKLQIDQLKARWQKRQKDIQLISMRNSTEAQRQYDMAEIYYQKEYNYLKQAASRERTRMNELHEIHLDTAINTAKIQANKKLISAWNERPLKTETINEALSNYLQMFLRDRIHLVNRYERLRAVDPEQAERQRANIHERLRLITDRIDDALKQLRLYPNIEKKIQNRIDNLFSEYDEVNQAAKKLLIDYDATTTSTKKTNVVLLGRDEKKIYPFTKSSIVKTNDTNNEYDYATNDEYDEDDDDDDDNDENKTSTSQTTTESDTISFDQIDVGNSDWDVKNDDIESTFEIKLDDDDDNDDQRAFVNEQNSVDALTQPKRISRILFVTYLPYVFGCLLVLSLVIGIFIFRFIRKNRHRANGYEKNYVFTEVECSTPDEKALHTLQMNGYENPTYKFFEGQTAKC